MKKRNMGKNSKNLDMVLALDKETYAIDSKNYNAVKTKKSQIIIGGSLRSESNHITHLKIKDFGQSKRWPTYSITREGKIYQHYDPMFFSDYMGIKEIDKKAVSIVLENMGMLVYDANKEKFINWINEEIDDAEKLVGEQLWKNYRYWEKYSSPQCQSLVGLCNYLLKEHDIKLDAIGHNVLETEIDLNSFQGILTKSNFDSEYTDLNPMFNWNKFLKMMNISIE